MFNKNIVLFLRVVSAYSIYVVRRVKRRATEVALERMPLLESIINVIFSGEMKLRIQSNKKTPVLLS